MTDRRFAYAVIFAVALGLFTAAVWRVKPLLSANDRSRWCTVWSLVERGSYQIDEIDDVPGWSTIDKVRQVGHYYSSKPPVLSTIVAGVYWVERAVTGWSFSTRPEEAMRLIDKFHDLLTTDTPASRDLGKLVVFCGVRDYPARVKCATLAWHTLKSALNGSAETVTTE